jgi:hypothetical protein
VSRVVIVARTRMHHEHVCVGGHDLDCGFRGVRLLDKFGRYLTSDVPFMVGETWNLTYRRKPDPPPHVEGIAVREYRLIERIPDLKQFVIGRAKPWSGGPETLFGGTAGSTPSGTAYVPSGGRLPPGSTGYWVPDEPLEQFTAYEKTRFMWMGKGTIKRFAWVGVAEPPDRIEKGSLVRVSLTHLFRSKTTPEGYYVQISGVID